MDLIEPLWTAAADWKVRILVIIVLANMLLAIRLYFVMGKMRFKAVREGRATAETYRATQNEPEDVAVFNRAVVNQFESPVLFYAIVAIALALNVSSWLTVLLAAAYVALRWMHGHEMIGAHDIMKRRKLFLRSLQVVLVMMVDLALSTLLWA